MTSSFSLNAFYYLLKKNIIQLFSIVYLSSEIIYLLKFTKKYLNQFFLHVKPFNSHTLENSEPVLWTNTYIIPFDMIT